MPACRGRRVLVSRPDQIDGCAPTARVRFDEIYTLDPDATPAGETERSTERAMSGQQARVVSTPADDPGVPFEGLHAKVFVFDRGATSTVLTGSANATIAAFSTNVEFLCELRGPRHALGVDSLMADSTTEVQTLRSFLAPHSLSDGDEAQENASPEEELLDRYRRTLAAVPMTVRATESENDRFDLVFATESPMPPIVAGLEWR